MITFDRFSLESELPSDAFGKVKAKFSVPKKWLAKHKADKKTVKLTQDGKEISARFNGQDEKNCFFSADIPFGKYEIIAEENSLKQAPKTRLWPILACLLVALIVIGALWVLSSFAPEAQAPLVSGEGIPDQRWAQGETHTLNLTNYFTDPDGEPIKITYTPVENIIITIRDGVASFKPDDDFVGNRSVRFAAIDAEGAKAESNVITLVVFTPEPVTLMTYVGMTAKAYFWHVVTAMALILLIILLLVYQKQVRILLEEEED